MALTYFPEMQLFSTNRRAPFVSFREALRHGLAPDGGLYLPTELPGVTLAEFEAWRRIPFPALASRVISRLLEDEFPEDLIGSLVSDALDFPVPVRPLPDGLFLLELFHGPTLAFKDFGARFLARVFGADLRERGDFATILVATSGDTGGAVARGFAGIAGTRVVVLYPAGRVSAYQEAQMATVGGNVIAVRVPGTFDDCQRLVKGAFADRDLRGLRLSSANSINIGRLLPQMTYYVSSWLECVPFRGATVTFSVPSGNLGNLTAGVMAARMGLPVSRFIAATNVNDVLPEYLLTGVLRTRPAVATLSNAMDVGDPSNFDRLAALCGSSVERMREQIRGECVSEGDTRAAIRQAYDEAGVVLDPHAAVAYAAARRYRAGTGHGAPVVVLATAHPAKFADAIELQLGVRPELPAAERGWRDRPLLAVDLPGISQAAFRDFLSALGPPRS
jgi:threonine synthase